MDILNSLWAGFAVAALPINLALIVGGCFAGTLIGALPGLGPVNGVAILIPLTFAFGLDATSSMILLSAVYYGCMYGGRISAILLNIPGDEPAIMTTLDGFPMARKGQAADALAISGVASFIGATLATIGLTLFAPLLAKAAIYFGPADYFALYVMAFATIGGITGSDPRKTLLAALLGLMLGTVGLDPSTGVARYTFGSFNLYDGFDPIVALVGLFAISEILFFLEARAHGGGLVPKGSVFPRFSRIREGLGASFRGSIIGFIAGILPGAGASLGAVMSYSFEKRISDKGTFGKGDPRGVAAPEAGNNAASGGALIPMLTLGVPGSGTTAVMLAMLISLNIQPGPLLFQRSPDLVWGLVAALYLANFVLLVLNLPLIGLFTRVLGLPAWGLMPLVVAISYLGVYAITHAAFDLMVMVGFGILGFVLRKLDFSLVPVVLGLLLGMDMENNLRRALSISGGDFLILLQSPIALAIYALTAAFLALSLWLSRRRMMPIPETED
ncbi:MAG: tripartite tricarboxylate transporter permease [Paracoccus sp. (in: a-proteobacteria)]|jgi:putative tricarboxylic transport membrane protein|uniref:tripartite tricarboxylate transporter permease n=1 Tax=unclassified Paracoccus (in: a-proteobacteria) TaxID=2688777 RepID=UPI000C5C8896|nr:MULTISPECIES: tripartite tricarboxylate transporter permease [unclassified Paracoccus (in: a-proteobacteria)]MAN57592.1 tripartite tricarboxylate transporter TctA [Paracoccus sp. (in: a-proteobacteria)]|tara:strand:- start:3391 stop:4893 length:1503 start_codon:yes stop_codon:yes gene_type:complete